MEGGGGAAPSGKLLTPVDFACFVGGCWRAAVEQHLQVSIYTPIDFACCAGGCWRAAVEQHLQVSQYSS